jgi:hypothetical protein
MRPDDENFLAISVAASGPRSSTPPGVVEVLANGGSATGPTGPHSVRVPPKRLRGTAAGWLQTGSRPACTANRFELIRKGAAAAPKAYKKSTAVRSGGSRRTPASFEARPRLNLIGPFGEVGDQASGGPRRIGKADQSHCEPSAAAVRIKHTGSSSAMHPFRLHEVAAPGKIHNAPLWACRASRAPDVGVSNPKARVRLVLTTVGRYRPADRNRQTAGRRRIVCVSQPRARRGLIDAIGPAMYNQAATHAWDGGSRNDN